MKCTAYFEKAQTNEKLTLYSYYKKEKEKESDRVIIFSGGGMAAQPFQACCGCRVAISDQDRDGQSVAPLPLRVTILPL